MAFTDTFKRFIGFAPDDDTMVDEFDDDYYGSNEMEEEEPQYTRRSNRNSFRRNMGIFDRDASPSYEEQREVSAFPAQMVLIKAKRYTEMERIAENLKQRRSIIVNFTEMDSGEAQRMLDFLSGTTFAMSGKLQCVSKGTYVFAVGQVDLVGRIENLKEKDSHFDD